MGRYIEPATDFGFKKLFGEEESKNVLKKFLFHILKLESPIVEITFLKQEQLPDKPEERVGIYDIYCIDERGERFIVEMQRGSQLYFKDRIVYYSTIPIFQQAQKGDWDYRLNPVYCVSILNFRLTEDERYLRRIQLSDIETHEVFYDKLTFVFIELSKFDKKLNELKEADDKWIYFLKHLSELNEIPPELSDEDEMNEAFRIAEIYALSEEERERYETSLKHLRDAYAVIETAKFEARKQALTEGRAQGVAEGIVEGRAKGMIEGELKSLFSFIELRFGSLPDSVKEKVQSICSNESLLPEIQRLVIDTDTLEEFEQKVNEINKENSKGVE